MMHNFNAGPSILPQEVLTQAAQAVLNFENSGLSILEIGHRTPLFENVMQEARLLVKELMQLDNDHEVLFLHGGATTQFMQVPVNLLNAEQLVAYTQTGTWSGKAIDAAKLFGHVEIAGSSKSENFTCMPYNLQVPPSAAYLHITTNETIAGTQWQEIPFQDEVPLVADMSSDIFSRQLDFNRFALMYAGAQKNIGAAGVSLVIVNKNILSQVNHQIPPMLDYRLHIREKSMLNTPPVFAIYVSMLSLRWLKAQGGISVIEKRNNAKSELIYNTLEKIPFINLPVDKDSRSKMNVVFTFNDKILEEKFLAESKAAGFYGIEGHRSVGGFRVSLYNAMPMESVETLTDFILDFAKKQG